MVQAIIKPQVTLGIKVPFDEFKLPGSFYTFFTCGPVLGGKNPFENNIRRASIANKEENKLKSVNVSCRFFPE